MLKEKSAVIEAGDKRDINGAAIMTKEEQQATGPRVLMGSQCHFRARRYSKSGVRPR